MAVYYSKHNDNIFLDEYNPGPYTLYGHNIFVRKHWDCKRRISVCVEDITSSGLNPEEYFTLVITKDISAVKPGFIESFPNLKDLIVEADLKKIECTPELEALLKKNDVVLRGRFNSPAEKLADRLDLRFIHKNIFLAVYINREYHESSELSLCFQEGEPPFFWRDDKTQGISAGNTGGGTVRTDLDEDFFVGCESAEAFADEIVGRAFEEDTRKNKELDAFLKEANRRLKK
ncbi:MAG: hypothetical protein IKX62_03515 [Bacteroidales bacterium]|nr:hypothetical protein [Bacteroidales bacterium]